VVKGRVLIIEQDEWTAVLLAKFLAEAGHEVVSEGEARAGFERVLDFQPDCILCSVNLPDIDGFWVARRVRAEPGRVGATPFLFLTDEADGASRLQGLNVGADLFLSRPYRNEEVVAQVTALIEMARRLVHSIRPGSESPPSSQSPTVLQGDLAHVSLSTALTLLELERRSGRFKLRGPEGEVLTLELLDGHFVRAQDEHGERPALDALRQVLRWKTGNFQFRPSVISTGERQGLSALLLEAMRLEDEASGVGA